jgi:hypothetical protein
MKKELPERPRVVVWVAAGVPSSWWLPASSFVERGWIYGGERSLYELACAATENGYDVELRGEISRHEFDEIADSAGVRPPMPSEPRFPDATDVLIIPEAAPSWAFARAALSPARAVAMLLAPPGLFGPPLVRGFVPPDPLTVDRESLSRPEGYRGMAAVGFELWTNSPRIAEDAMDAGAPCTFLGTGQPIPFPDPGPKIHPVAFVAANRWSPLAHAVAERLSVPALEIPEGKRPSLIGGLASARILIFPARFEGQSRLQIEARAVGTVPVVLSSNRFAAGLDKESGSVVVDSIEEMAPAIERLLARPAELEALSTRAAHSARSQVDWRRFVTKVGEALVRPGPEDADREARASIGDGMGDLVTRLIDKVTSLEHEGEQKAAGIEWLRLVLQRTEQERAALREEVKWLHEILAAAEQERAAIDVAANDVRTRRSVRAALRLADLTGRLRRRPRT